MTLAERLHDAGYATALIGKWHLGDADHAPETQGFDVNVGGTRWGAPQTFFWPYRGSGRFGQEFRFVPGLPLGKAGDYLSDKLTDAAISFIDRAGQQPFFLLLAHHAPHTPIEAPNDLVEHFKPHVFSQILNTVHEVAGDTFFLQVVGDCNVKGHRDRSVCRY